MGTVLEAANVVNALGTIVIGAVVGWIAWRQHRTDTRRLQAELFDRRTQVFGAAQQVLMEIVQNHSSEALKTASIHTAWMQSQLLVSKKLSSQFGELKKLIIRLAILSEELAKPDNGHDRTNWVREKGQIMEEVFEKYDQCIELFRREFNV